MHKSGFVNIVGAPNVGKSTLMNQLVGERLSIITPKAQTTRQRILGLVNHEDYQVVYSDTPGLVDPAYKLHESMMQYIMTSMEDADVMCVMVEIGEKKFKNEAVQKMINELDIPKLLLINKIDISNPEELTETVEFWRKEFPGAEVLPLSASEGFGVEVLKARVLELLPEGPAYFPKDDLTDKTERFITAEIIREEIFLNYSKEIPYACEVVIEEFKEEEDIIKIRAEIFVERDSQKSILIGKNGSALKRVGTASRKKIESFFQKKVFLNTFVKVDKNWRNTERSLKKYGYHI